MTQTKGIQEFLKNLFLFLFDLICLLFFFSSPRLLTGVCDSWDLGELNACWVQRNRYRLVLRSIHELYKLVSQQLQQERATPFHQTAPHINDERQGHVGNL
jgi:hypothetical protein